MINHHLNRDSSATDVETFRLPRWAGVIGILGVGLFGTLAVALLINAFSRGNTPPQWVVTIAYESFALGLTWWCWLMWRRRNQEVRTDAAGITWSPWQGRRIEMAWRDVVAIREYALRQKLELRDRGGQRVPIEYDLTNFAHLRDIVHHNTLQLRERHVLMREFHRHAMSRRANLLGAAFCAALAVVAFMKEEPSSLLIFVAVMVWGTIAWGFDIRAIDVGPTVLVTRAPFQSQVTPWRDVVGVELTVTRMGWTPVQTVRIDLRAGKPIRLSMIAEGAITLFDSIDAAWRQAATDLTKSG